MARITPWSSRLIRTVATVILAVALIGAERCPRGARDRAIALVVSKIVDQIWDQVDQHGGLRVHAYPRELDAGTKVEPFAPPGVAVDSMTCENTCLLFFIDIYPSGHFAHPVVIALYDLRTRELNHVEGDWWPLVTWPSGAIEPVFDTVAKREDPALIVYGKPSLYTVYDPSDYAQFTHLPRRTPAPTPSMFFDSGPPPTPAPSCSVWAMLVNGWDDPSDTFDEDTDGMYEVLRGHKVPEDHIYYLSPYHGDGLYKKKTTKNGVMEILTEKLPTRIQEEKLATGVGCTELLFFYSSHGLNEVLSCVSNKPFGGWIGAGDLHTWLGSVPCERVTIVIEACYSGSMVDYLKNHLDQERRLFTSTTKTGVSRRDVDWAGDPNPGDAGSETIWGYVEAFGSSPADGDSNLELSFQELAKYAIDNDITVTTGNTPQVYPSPPPTSISHTCYRPPTLTGTNLEVSDGPRPAQQPAGTTVGTIGKVVRCKDNELTVTVKNAGTATLAAATVNAYWTDKSPSPTWPNDFNQIGNTQLLTDLENGSSQSYLLNWKVEKELKKGTIVTLVATVDSPQDALTGVSQSVNALIGVDNNIGFEEVKVVKPPFSLLPCGCRSQ